MNKAVTKENLSELIEPVIHITEIAAQRILEIYETEFSVEDKDDKSPLTAADMAAHKAIIAGLNELTPDIPVLSEESSKIPFTTRSTWEQYWLVDPLDGTREFVKRNGEFTVNIALIAQHRPILGVVYVPVSKCCYYAAEGAGAFKREDGQSPVAIKVKQTSTDKFTVAGSRSHGSEEQQRFFAALGDETEVIAIGSSLKLCLVAEGKVDIYPRFGPTSEWDTAAAHCVVEQAGGIVTDTELRALQYNAKESVLNPFFLAIADASFPWSDYLGRT